MNRTTATLSTHQKHLLNFVYVLLISTFIIGITLIHLFPIMSQVIRLAGIGLIGLYIISSIQLKNKIAPEVKLFGLFIFWAFLSGVFVAQNEVAFGDLLSTIAQIWGLVLAITGFAMVKGSIKFNLSIFIIAVTILGVFAFMSNDFSALIDPLNRIRIASYLENPNDFAFYNVLGVFAILYLLNKQENGIIKDPKSPWIAFFALAIVYSGSQKSFASLIVLILSWLWFCYRKQILRKPAFGLLIIIGIGAIYFFANFTIRSTYLGQRMVLSSIGEESSLLKRESLYKEGFNVFLDNPLTGVGLANFTTYSQFDTYSHSDLLEVLSTTGIIGFLIYFSVYLVFWRRINRVQRNSKDPVIVYEMGVFKAFTIMLLFIGLGKPNFTSISAWFILASLIGYSFYLEQALFIGNKRKMKFYSRSRKITNLKDQWTGP